MYNWNVPSVDQAMSVPAVFRAVTMIANLIGSLALEAWRNGERMTANIPVLVSRPGIFTTPRDFFRDTGASLAAFGEFI